MVGINIETWAIRRGYITGGKTPNNNSTFVILSNDLLVLPKNISDAFLIPKKNYIVSNIVSKLCYDDLAIVTGAARIL